MGNHINIGYTLGDLAGIGPEIFNKFRASFYDENVSIILVDSELAGEAALEEKFKQIKIGAPSSLAGEHAYAVLEKASAMAQAKQIDYLITGPVAKESLSLAGFNFSGQTEALAHINNLSSMDIEMFFILDNLRVVLATRHVPLKDVSFHLEQRLGRVLENSTLALNQVFHIRNPRIAITGVNPHAGENGLLGREEKDIIEPLINKIRNSRDRLEIDGPFSADGVLANAAQNYLQGKAPKYDLIVAAYHDQVLPVIKGIGGFKAINLTVGLSFLRMSVDHGTGFDIAGRNLANPEGIFTCTNFCLELNRQMTQALKC